MSGNPAFRVAAATAVAVALIFPAAPSFGDPPPWAPAHGWRKKHDPHYVGYTGKKWDSDYGVVEGRCNLEAVGTVVGGAVGGVVGSRVGKGDGRVIATVLGAVVGAVIGGRIGRDLDERDRACLGHTLELVGDGQTVAWTNPNTGVNYVVTPLRGDTMKGQKCREFSTRANAGGRIETGNGRACRGADGEWRIAA